MFKSASGALLWAHAARHADPRTDRQGRHRPAGHRRPGRPEHARPGQAAGLRGHRGLLARGQQGQPHRPRRRPGVARDRAARPDPGRLAGSGHPDAHPLAIYEAAGFTGEQADQAAASVFTFVLGNALGTAAAVSLTRKLSRDGGNAEELIRDSMAKASEITAQFPRLHARLQTASAGYGAAPDNPFEFGLQAILDGLQAQLTARRTPAGQNAHATQPRPRTTRRT